MVSEYVSLIKKYTELKDFKLLSIPKKGSDNRSYYRIVKPDNTTLIFSIYKNYNDLIRFVEITELLKKSDVNVPEIIFINKKNKFLLLQDLGDFSLLDFVKQNINNNEELKKKYLCIISQLYDMQNKVKNKFIQKYKTEKFGYSMYKWETNYFKEMVLDFYLNADYDKQKLNDDFNYIADYLDSNSEQVFIHRDFQSTNIIIHNNKNYFIDYQNCYFGNPLYDLVSLVYDPYTDIKFKNELIDFYKNKFYNTVNFEKLFVFTVLQRLMQATAAYVKLGVIQKKKFFVKYIDVSLKSLYNIILEHKNLVPDTLGTVFPFPI